MTGFKCCVPQCTSNTYKNKMSDVHFFQFPSNIEMRVKWLESIRRKDWVPSDSTVVCSLHFLKDDYRKCENRHRLLPHAFPTIFPTYKLRRGRKPVVAVAVTSSPKKHAVASSQTKKKQHVTNTTPKRKPVRVVVGVHWTQTLAKSSNEGELLTQNEQSEVGNVEETTIRQEETNPNICITTDNQCIDAVKSNSVQVRSSVEKSTTTRETAPATNLVPMGPEMVQNNIGKPQLNDGTIFVSKMGRPFCSRSELKTRLRQNSSVISRLKRKVSCLKEELEKQIREREKLGSSLHEQVEKIQQDAANNVPAQFLLDQIICYQRKCPKYSKSTILTCLNWREKSPEGYSHIVSSGLLTLPTRVTLAKYVQLKHNGSESKSLLEKLLIKPDDLEGHMDEPSSSASSSGQSSDEDVQERIMSNAIHSICKEAYDPTQL